MSAICDKYRSLGGASGWLGGPTSSELPTPDGRGLFQHYLQGSIYWTALTEAHEVHGQIHARWASLGWERFGYPITDESATPDGIGRYNHFRLLDAAGQPVEDRSIYWTPNTGAFSVHGAIRAKWASLGWERFGYPITDESATPDGIGRYNHFRLLDAAGQPVEDRSIYWTPNTGAFSVHGAIRAKWASLGWERFGYPITDESGGPSGGRYNHFRLLNAARQPVEDRTIYWTGDTGAHEVHGAIRDAWIRRGGVNAWLGAPTSDEGGFPDSTGSRVSHFQVGSIYWLRPPYRPPTGDTIAYPSGWTAALLNAGDKFNWAQRNDDGTVAGHLKMYKDDAVIYGLLREPPHVNFPPTSVKDYGSFICAPFWHGDGDPPDADLNLHIIIFPELLPQGFWDTGFVWHEGENRASQIQAKLAQVDNRVQCEALMYGRSAPCDGIRGLQAPLLPGWAEQSPLSVRVDGVSLEGNLQIGAPLPGEGGNPMGWQVTVPGKNLQVGTPVRIRGFLTLDCHGTDCHEDDAGVSNVEIHPIYAIDVGENTALGEWQAVIATRAELWSLIDQLAAGPPTGDPQEILIWLAEMQRQIVAWHAQHDADLAARQSALKVANTIRWPSAPLVPPGGIVPIGPPVTG